MSVGQECANAIAAGHSVEDVAQRQSLYDAVIEWQGLFEVERFLGSYFATFSQVIAVHRGMRHAYFVQNHFQAWLATCWFELILLSVVLGMSSVLCLICKSCSCFATRKKQGRGFVGTPAATRTSVGETHCKLQKGKVPVVYSVLHSIIHDKARNV